MAAPQPEGVSASRLANLAAPEIEQAFIHYQDEFRRLTSRARARFEKREWQGTIADAMERLELYGQVIGGLEDRTRLLLGPP
jgi:isocitrate dehydrogenase kinase/phosphatase